METLFPSSYKQSYGKKELSINSICPNKKDEIFDVEELIRTRKQKRKKLLDEYLCSLAGAYPPLEELMLEVRRNVLPPAPKEHLN